jgi:hypothetical protein
MKSDKLINRMVDAFGAKTIEDSFQNMVTAYGACILDYLTDEARDELLRRCILTHKMRRRFAAESRKFYRERAAQ